jgi:Thoeris protein ThsA, Macro domain
LVLGVLLVALPYLQIDKDYHLTTHSRTSVLPVVVGVALLSLGTIAFGLILWVKRQTDKEASAGLDFTRVKENKGGMWTIVSGCEIHVIDGLLQDFNSEPGTTIVLPCNEYFDDECAGDTKSALGAYVNRVFDGQVEAFVSLVKNACKGLGPGSMQQKTENERAESFGVGRCLLLLNPLCHSVPVALVSTTTQRAGQGLAARISYLFDAMRELVAKLADARLNKIVMPILGSGHGRLDPPLALVGLLLAVAEAARYGQGGQRLRKASIIVFKRDAHTPAEVDPVVIRRALALVGSRD